MLLCVVVMKTLSRYKNPEGTSCYANPDATKNTCIITVDNYRVKQTIAISYIHRDDTLQDSREPDSLGELNTGWTAGRTAGR